MNETLALIEIECIYRMPPHQMDGKTPLSPEIVGKDLEHQLLFGEHANQSASPAASSAAAGGAPSRIQAGFILVKLNGQSSVNHLHGEPATATTGTTDGLSADGALLDSRTSVALEAATKAQQATGAPIMLACSNFVPWSTIKAAHAIATAGDSRGADSSSSRVVVAGMHGGVSQPLADQAALLNTGTAVLCFDCFGRVEWLPGSDYYPSDEESAMRIAELVREGLADRIVISSGVSRRMHLSRYGNAMFCSRRCGNNSVPYVVCFGQETGCQPGFRRKS